ncbi:MFS transporter [Variovorax sp. MHTC-1]|uniref:MFS transporter n=1 Tax=Variovorax sp. MHTC-1 TaxID=2495593 RepID=UPI000F896FED|nr:MFS transporter [Variovorax sp. MHTC-1]RST50389.1 MFS transporter [Variovorax sp. MHTC-1]
MTNSVQSGETASPARGSIPAIAWLLTGSVAVIGSNSLLLAPIAPEVARSFAASTQTVMTAAAAFGVGTALGALLLARFIDRFGARRMLRAALFILAVALASSSAAPTVAALIAAQLLAGLASGIAIPSIYALAAAVAPHGRTGETLGVVLTGWTLSMVAGVSLSAALADLVHWRVVYAAVALLALVAAAAISFSGYRDPSGQRATHSPIVALKIPGVVPLLIASGSFSIAFYGTYGYLGDHLHSGLHRPVSANGVAALAYGVGFGAAALLDSVIDRIGAHRALSTAFASAALVYLAFAAASGTFAALLTVVFAWGLINHFGLNALVLRLAAIDPVQRSNIMGLNSAVTYLAVFAGTMAFGPIYTAFGFAALPTAAAALMLVAALATRSRAENGLGARA